MGEQFSIDDPNRLQGGGGELTPEIEKEEEALETRIDEHVAKLKEIAEVFGIDVSQFSDENDQEFARSAEDKSILCEGQRGGRGKPVPETYFTIEEQGVALASYPLNYDEYQAEIIRQKGRITDFGHDQFVGTMEGGKKLLFTQEEQTALDYFTSPNDPEDPKLTKGDLKSGIGAKFVLIELRKRAISDENTRKFIDWINSNGWVPAGMNDFGNMLGSYRKVEQDEEKIDALVEVIGSLSKAETGAGGYRFTYKGSKKMADAISLGARLLTRISEIFNTRSGYLIDLANSGDPRFKKNDDSQDETSSSFEVSPEFEFTKEDAKKAVELDLPWSKIREQSD